MMQEDTSQEQRIVPLTPTQQGVLRNFQEICQIQDEYLCIQILQENHWDFDRALNSMMQGGGSNANDDILEENSSDAPLIADRGNTSQSSPVGNRLSGTNAASAVTNTSSTAGGGGSLLDLLLVPLRWLFQARPISLNPTADIERFLIEYNGDYGITHPTFHMGSYQSAVERAFNESKFLLVYLHSPMHEDSSKFCTEIFGSRDLIHSVDEQMIFWAGKVWDAEGYGLSIQLHASTFPFLAVLVPKTARMVQIADRIQGYPTTSTTHTAAAAAVPPTTTTGATGVLGGQTLPGAVATVMERLNNAMAVFAPMVTRNRVEQQRRQETTRLRDQQMLEYQESLEEERREELRRREEIARKEQEEEEAKQREEEEAAIALSVKLNKEGQVNKIRQYFQANPEPKTVANSEMAMIKFQLPRGKKLARTFLKTDIVQRVRDFLTLHFYDEGEMTKNFSIFIPHPRTEINNMEQTLEAAGLHPRGMLYVQDLDT